MLPIFAIIVGMGATKTAMQLWGRTVVRQFRHCGVEPVPVLAPHADLLKLEMAKTGGIGGVHRGTTLRLPSDTDFFSGVLHELAHAMIWKRGDCVGDYQWGLSTDDPTSWATESEVLCVNLELLRRYKRGIAMFRPDALERVHPYYSIRFELPGDLSECLSVGQEIVVAVLSA